MKIGLLKEIKKEEYRVALVPNDVKKLTDLGYDVIFELDCGKNANFDNSDYVAVGAEPRKKSDIFKEADIIVKVKTPEKDEPTQFRNEQILFSYLHYDGNESLKGAEEIRNSGTTAIAFEWVEEKSENGSQFPLLTPMSEFTGSVGALKVLELYRHINKKIAGDFNINSKPATVMIIGLGTIGLNALNVFLHNGLKIIIVDKHPETLDLRIKRYIPNFLWEKNKSEIEIIQSFEEQVPITIGEIKEKLPEVNILFFSAVRRPTFKDEHLIYKDMLKLMPKNSILIDAAANDKDLVETIESYPEIDRVYKVDGVYHYANDHIPTMAANQSSKVLSHVITPYLIELASKGIKAIFENDALYSGLSIAGNEYTHKYTCQKRELKYTSPEIALEYNEEYKEIDSDTSESV